MKKEDTMNRTELMKRLVALLVAVVFVFGTMLIPAQIYADEPENQDAAVTETTEEATEPEAAENSELTEEEVAEEEAAEEDGEAAPEEAEAEAPAEEKAEAVEAEEVAEPEEEELPDLTDLVVATDENGNSISIKSLDKDDYKGFLFKIKENTSKIKIKKMEKAAKGLDEDQEIEEVIDDELYVADSLETIAEVAPEKQIEYIEPNYRRTMFGGENKILGSKPLSGDYGWQHDMVNSYYAWDRGVYGDGATVAVLDTGAATGLPIFDSDTFVDKYNAVDGSSDVTDYIGHGTAVSATIASSLSNSYSVRGIMPETKIMPVKVFTDESAYDDDIIDGIYHAVNYGADVINMSLGGTYYSTSIKNACSYAAKKRLIVVAAAGNEALDGNPIEYPAAYSCVISVGAVNENGKHASFSNYNKYVAVAAPGEDIYLPWRESDGWYLEYIDGTSFASPMVAAMAAMVKARYSSVANTGFLNMIKKTSIDKGAKGKDKYYGYGIMNIRKAYRYMEGDVSLYAGYLSCIRYTYSGYTKTPKVKIKRFNSVVSSSNYSVVYPKGRKKVGTYKITVKGKGNYYGTKTLTFKICPPLVKGLKKPKVGKHKITVRWKKMSKKQKKKYRAAITGYQVRVSRKANFSKSKKVKVKGIGKTKAVVKGLKGNRKYYIQYRSYKVVNGVTYYSKWSKKKSAWTD